MIDEKSFISMRYQEKLNYPGIVIGDICISSKSYVHNLGVIFDHYFTGEKEVNNKIKQCYYHIKNVGKAWSYLTCQATEILVHAFYYTKFD